jgi:thiol-disulfide isomerase/thioredoxin
MKNYKNIKINVILSEWCPACLEYKLVLNKLRSNKNIEVLFFFPEEIEIPIRAIPTTFFSFKKKVLYVVEGYIGYENLLKIYNQLLTGG